MKRIIVLMALIATIFSVFAFCGCNKEENNEIVETTAETNDETQPAVEDKTAVIYDKDGIYYTIIRGTYAGDIAVGAAVDLNAAFRNIYPGEWRSTIKEDFVLGQKRDDIYDIEGCEILVGITNRRESHDVYGTLQKNEYAIKCIGEKIVIIGYDEYATASAVEFFIENYIPTKGSEKLEVDPAIDIKGEASLRKIAVNSEADYRIMTWNLGCMVSEEKKGEVECVDILLRYLPDIIGLQECNAAVHSKVLNNLPDFYQFADKKHKNSSTVNYTPIIYNSELFTLLKSDLVWLRGRYTGTNTKSLNWAVFEDKNGEKFALINYHGAVCSNSYKGFENYTQTQLNAKANEWRLDNVVQVLEIKDAIVAEYGNIPIMVSGDNNFNSGSQPYKNLTSEGFVDSELTARVSRKTGYKTSYSYGNVPGEGLSIDHIFGLNGPDFVVHDIVRGDDVWKASDHCPVFVDFNIKK